LHGSSGFPSGQFGSLGDSRLMQRNLELSHLSKHAKLERLDHAELVFPNH